MQILILTGLCESKKRCLWKQHCCHGLSEEGEKKDIESLNISALMYLRQVIYGSTQLTNAAQFLGQLSRLGAEQ